MATNTLLTTQMVAYETLRLLVGNLQGAKHVNTSYASDFGKAGRKIGASINMRLPNKFATGTGAAVTPGNYTERVVPLTVDTQRNVALEFSSAEASLSLDDYSNRIIKPQVSILAGQVETDIIKAIAQNAFNQVGTPGTVITTTDVFIDAKARLSEFLIPNEGIVFLVAPKSAAKAKKLMLNLFTPITNDEIVTSGAIGAAFGADWYESQYQYTHTVGAYLGTPLVNGAGQTGSSIVIDGLSTAGAGAFKKGDIVSFAGVNFAHPVTGADTGTLAQFVITADVNASGGNATLPIYPAITTSGPFKTVTASPADNAAITIAGAAGSSYSTNVMFHRDAVAFASVPLDTMGAAPGNVTVATDEESGITVTLEQFRDGRTGSTVLRADVLYGVAPLRQEAACRVITGI